MNSDHCALSPPSGARTGFLAAFMLLLWAGLAFADPAPFPDEEDIFADMDDAATSDPLEGWNRAIFAFNDLAIDHVLRPLHNGYVAITPAPVRKGIHNVFHNILFPVRFTNNLLQGKGKAAGVELSYFILNSLAGLGGIVDLSPYHKPIVLPDDEDMGQTFAVWGLGEGFYIVWPFLGPSTLKDTLGDVGDSFLDPITYLDPWISYSLTAARIFHDLDRLLDLYDDMRQMAVEPYSALRDGYIQYRRAKAAR
ncbi:MAG: VacJ family lipoprotein [Deltaproteobacteria bacterium]|nr:VacJ family lipoprotein [Deltaproteobacteria bacterium]